VRKVYLSLLIVSLFSGLLVSWQLRANLIAEAQAKQEPSLVDIIKSLEQEDAALEETIAKLRQDIDNLQKDSSQGQGRLAQLQKELETLRLYAGLVPVAGSGITVVVDDNNAGAQAAQKSSPATYRPEDYIIHDKNVLYLVNDLKNAGAEAIAINGLRLVTTSHIRCVGTVILVNSTRIAPPYEIQALGDPEALTAALQQSLEYAYLKSRDFPIKITTATEMVLPAYNGVFPSEHLRLLQAGGH